MPQVHIALENKTAWAITIPGKFLFVSSALGSYSEDHPP